MAIVVEDGTIVSGANSYASESELTTRASARGITLTAANGTPEQILLKSMDFIESQNYAGSKLTKAQVLQWPRAGVYVDGFLVEDDEIPVELKIAQMETALSIDAGVNPLSTLGRETRREKVGDIEVEYVPGSKDSPDIRAISAYLDKLLVNGANVGVVQLERA
jgi:hypothetical protein